MNRHALLSAMVGGKSDATSVDLFTSLLTREGVPQAVAERWAREHAPDLTSEVEAQEERPRAAKGSGEVEVRGPIVGKGMAEFIRWLGGEAVSGADFADDLRAASDGSDTVTVRINSPGGSIYQLGQMGAEIESARKRGVQVNTRGEGLAASAGAILFLYGQDRELSDLTSLMFHRGTGVLLSVGNGDEIQRDARSVAEQLRVADGQMIARMVKVGALSESDVVAKMDEGDWWMAPGEAVEAGYATAVYEGDHDDKEAKAAASASADNPFAAIWDERLFAAVLE